jgi:hypothetical protein
MAVYLPQDWPAEVRPPGSEDFEATAVWLLDLLPEYRQYPAMRHPVILVVIACHTVTGTLEGARQDYRIARTARARARRCRRTRRIRHSGLTASRAADLPRR